MLVKLSMFILLQLTVIDSRDYNSYENNYYGVRKKFLYKIKQNKKIEMFDKMNANKTIFVDNILHMQSNCSKVKELEESFRNVLAMKGVTYVFKRDFFWRTWRRVGSGNSTVVCYRCQNDRDVNREKCHSGGYWVIEEKPPPCPYEIFSLKTDWEMCVVNNYNQYQNPYNTICPSTINKLELKSACDNPIKTRWQIRRNYTDVSERNSVTVICQGRESCEVSTMYTIMPDSIVFRIINSTNHIFYSRVMKSGFNNYVCIDDCGNIDPKTDLISRNERPYRVDLLKKNKREFVPSMTSVLPIQKKKVSKRIKNPIHIPYMTMNQKMEYSNKKRERFFEMLNYSENNTIMAKKNEHNIHLFKIKNSVTKSDCKRLEEKYNGIEKEDYRDYY